MSKTWRPVPPEQLKSSKGVDARADVGSAGVLLYEMLTGRTPFEAEALPTWQGRRAEDEAATRRRRAE